MRIRLMALTCGSLIAAGCGTASVAPSAANGPGNGASVSSAPSSSSAASVAASSSGSAASAGASASAGGATAPGQACVGSGGSESTGSGASVAAGTLSGVQFVSADQGWAAGQSVILATSDGGAHWHTQLTGKLNLTAVDFVNAQDGWAVGTTSLLATTDGGAHWTALPEPCAVLRSVHFTSPSAGVAVAGGDNVSGTSPAIPYQHGSVLTTSDGGHTWRELATPADAQTVCFSGASDGWLGADGQLYRTGDSGRTWTAVATTSSAIAAAGQRVMSVQCAGPGSAWAVATGPGSAMNQQPHVGYHADQAGATAIFAEHYFQHPGGTPKAPSPGSIAGPFSALSPTAAVFIDWCSACGYGTAPWDLATDSGATLTRQGNVANITAPEAASFLSAQVGWVAGTAVSYPASGTPQQQQRIVATTDGGKTWQVQYVGPWISQ